MKIFGKKSQIQKTEIFKIFEKFKNFEIFEKSKNHENSYFWRFWGALFPYKSYRIFIKICDSKKFNRFFLEKIERFSKIFDFLFFNYISSPISESFIAQLLLHRALDQKDGFFSHIFGKIPGFCLRTFCQCSKAYTYTNYTGRGNICIHDEL